MPPPYKIAARRPQPRAGQMNAGARAAEIARRSRDSHGILLVLPFPTAAAMPIDEGHAILLGAHLYRPHHFAVARPLPAAPDNPASASLRAPSAARRGCGSRPSWISRRSASGFRYLARPLEVPGEEAG